MRAVARRGEGLVCVEMPAPKSGPGQVIARTLACGICGSDLHAVHHLETVVALNQRAGGNMLLEPGDDMVFGHEFCAEIVEYGPQTQKRFAPGTRVVSVPVAIGPRGPETIGFSTRFPGGFAEHMVLMEALLLEVPNGLAPEYAAMVEPMAVGVHAVAQADLSGHPVALVIGCGPVGLAVIAALKRKGVGPIIASDFSPARRRLAEIMGADIIVDPGEHSPHQHWEAYDVPADLTGLGMARLLKRNMRPAAIFECVGAPGLLQALIEKCPPLAQIIVVGVCMEEERILPTLAICKHLRMNFVFGYTPEEFAATLDDIAEGHLDVTPLFSKMVGLSGVADAFAALGKPDECIKIIVDPRRA